MPSRLRADARAMLAQREARRRQQDHRQRHLRDDQHAAAALGRGRAAAALRGEHLAQIGHATARGSAQRKHQRADQREQGDEAKLVRDRSASAGRSPPARAADDLQRRPAPAAATARRAITDSSRPSIRNWRISRPLRAPSAVRTASSRARASGAHHHQVRDVGGRDRHQQADRQQEQRDHDPEALAAGEIANRDQPHLPAARWSAGYSVASASPIAAISAAA